MIASTSIDSLITHKTAGLAGAQRDKILKHLHRSPRTAYSRNELSRDLNLPIQSICGRIGELKDDDLVVEDSPRRDAITGRKVKPIRISPDLITTIQ